MTEQARQAVQSSALHQAEEVDGLLAEMAELRAENAQLAISPAQLAAAPLSPTGSVATIVTF